MTDVPDYVLPGSSTTQAVHTEPPQNYQWQSLSQDQLNSIRSNLITSIIQVVIQAVTGIFIPGGGLGGATGQLSDWSGGLNDLAQGILDNIWNAFDSGVPGNTSGNSLFTMFNGIFGIHRTGSGAVSVNAVQDARLDAFLITGGSSLGETFNGSASTALNTTNWNQTYAGSGSGTYGLSGSGSGHWNTSGSSSRESRNRYKAAALTTDTQSVAVTLASNFQQLIGDETEIRLLARMNAAETDRIEARIQRTSVEIGYVLSGTYTRLGSAVTISGNTSGTWQLKVGTLASSREFVLLHNGVTVISQTDTGASSAMDSSHWYTGFTAKAGWGFTFVVIPIQVAPPDVESWAASDRPAAA